MKRTVNISSQNNIAANKTESPPIGFTHSGKFHADDVFSAALLTYMKPDILIIRGHKVPEGFGGIVFDIGGGKFDHHQNDRRYREGDVPYAAFGLLWEHYGSYLVGKEEAAKFDMDFVQPLDLADNTGCGSILSSIISKFNPSWDSDEDCETAFEEAKKFALKILSKELDAIYGIQRAEKVVKEALDRMEDNLLILEKFAPWRPFVSGTSAEFVIYPSSRGGFAAQGVPIDCESTSNELKVAFPKEWAGLMDEELERISGIKGLVFCHASGFLIAAETLESAVAACRLANVMGNR